jgi:hypothetical protein
MLRTAIRASKLSREVVSMHQAPPCPRSDIELIRPSAAGRSSHRAVHLRDRNQSGRLWK